MTNNGPREIPMMMKPFLMPMVIDGSKTQSRRLGERWKKINIGDRVWMREAWQSGDDKGQETDPPTFIWYKGDMSLRGPDGERIDDPALERPTKWRPAVHMPRSVCRFVGEVIGVRQEFLQDITNEDAKAEGMVRIDFGKHFSESRWNQANKATQDVESLQRRRFARLMECMTPGIWAKNPMVTVIEWRKA